MSLNARTNSPDKDLLRTRLSKWAARHTLDSDEQQLLIERTIAVALDDANVLYAPDLVSAMKGLMDRLSAPETSKQLSAFSLK
jgi:hypothetical protein